MLKKLKRKLFAPFRKKALDRAKHKRSIRFDIRLLKNERMVDFWKNELEKVKIDGQIDMVGIQNGLKLFRDYDGQLKQQINTMDSSKAREMIEEKRKSLQEYIDFLEEKKRKKTATN